MINIITHAVALMLEIKGRPDGPTKAADILAAMYLELDKDRPRGDRGLIIGRRPEMKDWLDQCARCIATHKGYAVMFPESAAKMDARLLTAIEDALKPAG